MEREAHLARHIELHRALDELLADYLIHHPGRLLKDTTIYELMDWAYQETLEPTETPDDQRGA